MPSSIFNQLNNQQNGVSINVFRNPRQAVMKMLNVTSPEQGMQLLMSRGITQNHINNAVQIANQIKGMIGR
jgi:hypothetical protein